MYDQEKPPKPPSYDAYDASIPLNLFFYASSRYCRSYIRNNVKLIMHRILGTIPFARATLELQLSYATLRIPNERRLTTSGYISKFPTLSERHYLLYVDHSPPWRTITCHISCAQLTNDFIFCLSALTGILFITKSGRWSFLICQSLQ